MSADRHLHLAAPHVLDLRLVLAAAAVEQGERLAGLQPQHLHVAGGAGGSSSACRSPAQSRVKARHRLPPKA